MTEIRESMEAKIETLILELCATRGAGRTICPSEVARALAGQDADWRAVMDDVRRVGAGLMRQGRIVISQPGTPVDPGTVKGPIRFGLVQSPR
ncbi:MAG: DUF3253 domain-containing protein [Hyphomicrobiaceae bacterium]